MLTFLESLGIEYNKKLLEEKNLETSEENIFISATCGAQGIDFLQGNAELGVRYAADVKEDQSKPSTPENLNGVHKTNVSINGQEYEVTVNEK